MDKATLIQLFDYTFWADRRVFACAEALSEQNFRAEIDFSVGSIARQIVHIMGVEYWWTHFLATDELDFFDESVHALPRAELRQHWDAVEQQVRATLETLTEAELQRKVKPPFWDDDEPPVKVWQALFQVINHSSDHRAQTMAMLHTQFGAPTVEQDFLAYLDEHADDSA